MIEPHTSGAVKHYHVAVGYHEAKIGTLFELLRALHAKAPAGIVICCNARDSLDYVCSTALGFASDYKVLALHADLSDQQIDSTVQYFRRKCNPDIDRMAAYSEAAAANRIHNAQGNGADERQQSTIENTQNNTANDAPEPAKMVLLVTTDAPLKSIDKDKLPLGPLLLINYDLPTRKDTYMRRMSTVLGSRSSAQRQRITITFVEAGKVEDFRQFEALCERPVEEMPVHALDILGGSSSS